MNSFPPIEKKKASRSIHDSMKRLEVLRERGENELAYQQYESCYVE